MGGADVSREGVQRDLLPLIEGCTVNTKLGMVKTDHILFITPGAFHLSKPSDLVPELQGRLPIRVELKALSPEDFERILSEPHASLTEQYRELLKTEGLNIEFMPEGDQASGRNCLEGERKNRKHRCAPFAHPTRAPAGRCPSVQVISPAHKDEPIRIDAEYVNSHLGELAENEPVALHLVSPRAHKGKHDTCSRCCRLQKPVNACS